MFEMIMQWVLSAVVVVVWWRLHRKVRQLKAELAELRAMHEVLIGLAKKEEFNQIVEFFKGYIGEGGSSAEARRAGYRGSDVA